MCGVISLPDATSYDNICANNVILILKSTVNLIIWVELNAHFIVSFIINALLSYS